MVFIKWLSSEVAKRNDNTKLVQQSKQELVGNAEDSYNTDGEGIKTVASECW